MTQSSTSRDGILWSQESMDELSSKDGVWSFRHYKAGKRVSVIISVLAIALLLIISTFIVAMPVNKSRVLTLQPPYVLYGFTIDENGNLLPSCELRILDRNTMNSSLISSDDGGFYQFDLSSLDGGYQTGDTIWLLGSKTTEIGLNQTSVTGSFGRWMNLTLSAHTPTRIDSNSDFDEMHGVSGGIGTAGNPYIIEGRDINGSGRGYCIYVGNTTDHFIIRNCKLHNASGDTSFPWRTQSGLVLFNAFNGGIWNNVVSSNLGNGTQLESSSNNTVRNNNCSMNGRSGVVLYSSSGNTLSNNNCSSNHEDGIFVDNASSNNIISWNELHNNSGYGICVWSGSGNRFWNDVFIDNNGAGSVYDPSHIQAYDGGTDNWWNSTGGYGNYWSDWVQPDANGDGIVDIPYFIQVSNSDSYPLTHHAWACNWTIHLLPGWNLVSIPLADFIYEASTMGLAIGDMVCKWNSTTLQYSSYIVGISPRFYDFKIEACSGYFIYTKVEKDLSLQGNPPDKYSNYSIPLNVPAGGGWVVIGWPSFDSSRHASDLASYASGTHAKMVCRYNSTTKQYEPYIVGISPPRYNFNILPGDGLWMYVDAPGGKLIYASSKVTNKPPYFTSNPITTCNWNANYSYTVAAMDPESSTLTYGLQTNWTGLSINPASGLLNRTEPHANATYYAHVNVTDGVNKAVWQNFTVQVTNQAPYITSTAPTTWSYAQDFYYNVTVIDPERASLTYSMTNSTENPVYSRSTCVADNFVANYPGQSNMNFNGYPTIQIYNDPGYVLAFEDYGYFRWDLASVAPGFTNVYVNYYCVGADNPKADWYASVATDWSETGITWNNQPGMVGDALLEDTSSRTAAWHNVSSSALTALIQSQYASYGKAYLACKQHDPDGPSFEQLGILYRESPGYGAYLVFQYGGNGGSQSQPMPVSINSANGHITGTAPFTPGVYNFTVKVTDGNKVAHQDFTLTVTNFAPYFTSTAPTTWSYAQDFYYNVTATDPERAPLTYSMTNSTEGGGGGRTTGPIYAKTFGYYDGSPTQAYISTPISSYYNRYNMLSFNLASIPSGATINDIAVYDCFSYVSMSGGRSMTVHAIQAFGWNGSRAIFSALGSYQDGINSHTYNWYYPANEAFNISMGTSLQTYYTGHGMKSTWQTQFNTNKTIYMGFSTITLTDSPASWGNELYGSSYAAYIVVNYTTAGGSGEWTTRMPLSINSTNGRITGAGPFTPGIYDFTVNVTDGNKVACQYLHLSVTNAPLNFTTSPVTNVNYADAYDCVVVAVDPENQAIYYDISTDYPGGLTIDHNTGELTHAGPLTAGSYYVHVNASTDRTNAALRQTIWQNFTLTVFGPPVASFTMTGSGYTVNVDASASTSTAGIASYTWNWGDEATGSGVTAMHTYEGSGTFTITLTVTDTYSQTSSVSHSLTLPVGPPPTAAFTVTVSANRYSVSVDGSASTSSAGIVSYDWNWGDNVTGRPGVTSSHSYMPTGYHTITLTVTDTLGRIGTANETVFTEFNSIWPLPFYVYGWTYASDGVTALAGCTVTITDVRTGTTLVNVVSDATGFYAGDISPLLQLAGDTIIVNLTGPTGETGSGTGVVESTPYVNIDVTLSG